MMAFDATASLCTIKSDATQHRIHRYGKNDAAQTFSITLRQRRSDAARFCRITFREVMHLKKMISLSVPHSDIVNF